MAGTDSCSLHQQVEALVPVDLHVLLQNEYVRPYSESLTRPKTHHVDLDVDLFHPRALQEERFDDARDDSHVVLGGGNALHRMRLSRLYERERASQRGRGGESKRTANGPR